MRIAPAVVVLCGLALASPGSAPTKEGARAHLTTSIALGAAPGTVLRVGWIVSAPDEEGDMTPFGATGMFVRLLSRTGAPAKTGFATQSAGRYSARARVPKGGIGGVRAGLRGTTDIFFPVVNDPFRSRGGVRCDVAAVRATLRAFVDAYSRGDLRRLDQLFSRAHFVWYSANPPGARLRGAASNRETLSAYFRGRHSVGDRLALVSYRFNGYSRGSELGHFDWRARRRADDFRGGRWFDLPAKGALDCAKPPVTFAVLSLGGPSR